ncbi:MAG: ABC transporter permease [Ardenticatenaceae bacterium]|nr:ABC transporter permease [Ardenticatenaceae bacterium]
MIPTRFILRRLVLQIGVLIGLTALTFLLMFKLPGDPTAALLAITGFTPNPQTIARFKARWGFDKPLYEQYLLYLGNLARGDLGESLVTKRPISQELMTYFPATAELALAAALIAAIGGIPAGVASAVRRNSIVDHLVRVVSLFGVSMPIFWLSILALYVFYYKLGWVPSSQRIALTMSPPPPVTRLYLIDTLLAGDFKGFVSVVQHLFLPAFMLGFSVVGLLARITRASMLEVLGQDYIRTARAKGLKESAVLYHHAIKNAMIPIITAMGLLIGSLLAGAVLTETIFAWPGLGRFAVQSIFYLDRPAVMGVTLLIGVIYSLVNLGVDLVIAYLDPRIRY